MMAPFFIYPGSFIEGTLYQGLFFQVMTILGVSLFGVTTNKSIMALASLFLIVAISTQRVFEQIPLYHVSMCVSGILFLLLISPADESVIKKAFFSVCILSSFYVFFEYFYGPPAWIFLKYLGYKSVEFSPHIAGALWNKNHSGALIAATIPFIPAYMLPIPAIALFILDSDMPSIMGVMAVITLLFLKKGMKKRLIMAWALVGISAVLLWIGVIPHSLASGRIEAWKVFFDWFGFRPFGEGFGFITLNFKNVFNIEGKYLFSLHNELLEAYSIAGIAGIVAFCGVSFQCLNEKDTQLKTCMIILLFNSLANFTFHIAPLFIVFGACYAITIKRSHHGTVSS